MRTTILLGLLLIGCANPDLARAPPLDRFYFPTALAHDRPDGGQGVLYVASGNYDKRYSHGTLLAVDLDALGIPDLGTPPPGGIPLRIEDLQVGDSASLGIASDF